MIQAATILVVIHQISISLISLGSFVKKKRKDSRSRPRIAMEEPGSKGNFLEDNVEDSRSIFQSNIASVSHC